MADKNNSSESVEQNVSETMREENVSAEHVTEKIDLKTDVSDDTTTAEEDIILTSVEGENFTVKPDFKNLSITVRSAIEIGGNKPIKFENISSETYKIMIEWTDLYLYNPPPVEELDDKVPFPKNYAMKGKIIISDQDKEFFDRIGYKAVLDLVQAANTLEYMALYKNCIRYLALQVKGKTSDEVYQLFKPAMQEYGFFLDDAEETSSKKRKHDEAGSPGDSSSSDAV